MAFQESAPGRKHENNPHSGPTWRVVEEAHRGYPPNQEPADDPIYMSLPGPVTPETEVVDGVYERIIPGQKSEILNLMGHRVMVTEGAKRTPMSGATLAQKLLLNDYSTGLLSQLPQIGATPEEKVAMDFIGREKRRLDATSATAKRDNNKLARAERKLQRQSQKVGAPDAESKTIYSRITGDGRSRNEQISDWQTQKDEYEKQKAATAEKLEALKNKTPSGMLERVTGSSQRKAAKLEKKIARIERKERVTQKKIDKLEERNSKYEQLNKTLARIHAESDRTQEIEQAARRLREQLPGLMAGRSQMVDVANQYLRRHVLDLTPHEAANILGSDPAKIGALENAKKEGVLSLEEYDREMEKLIPSHLNSGVVAQRLASHIDQRERILMGDLHRADNLANSVPDIIRSTYTPGQEILWNKVVPAAEWAVLMPIGVALNPFLTKLLNKQKAGKRA